jgi:hypothetical protein
MMIFEFFWSSAGKELRSNEQRLLIINTHDIDMFTAITYHNS